MLHFEKRLEAHKLAGSGFLRVLWIFYASGTDTIYH
jgi:hypothetical protein